MIRTLLLVALALPLACTRRAPESATATATELPPDPTTEPSLVAEPPPVWLDLEPGPHHVGHRQELRFDPSRSYTNPLAPLPQRPILIHRWYPADASNQAMTVADYLEVADDSAFGRLLEHHLRGVFATEVLSTFSAAFATAKQRTWLTEAQAEPVLARRDAPARAGAWPVVLYHPGLGGSLTDNFVLFEYLASHGFLVVSSAFVPAASSRFGIGWDPSTSIADLDFLVRELSETGEITDTTSVAVMGHSYGAQAALIYVMEGRRIDAVVSIDSTIENSDPAAPWFRDDPNARWLNRGERIQVPSLLLASQQATDTTFFDSLTASDRRHAIVPVLDHNDFTSHGGVLRTLHGHSVREAEGSAAAFAQSHVWVIRTIHAFLAGVLQRDAAQLARLDHDGVVHHPAVLPAGPAQHLAILAAEGVAGIVRFCEPPNATPICVSERVLHELAWTHLDGAEPDRAVALLREVVDAYPTSAASHDLLGEALLESGDPTAAVAAFERALALTEASGGGGAGYYRVRAIIAGKIAETPPHPPGG